MSLKSLLFATSTIIMAMLANGAVHQLTNENFDGFIKDHPLTLVKFFAPWCGHCKTLAPHYEAASDLVDKVALAEVDVTEQEALGSRFEVRGFPTIKFFRDGVPEEYTGGRTSETIVEWVNLMTSDPVTAAESVEKAKEQFPEEALIVGSFAKDSDEAKTFSKIAETNRLLGRFISTEGSSPSITVYRVGETSGAEIKFVSEEEIVEFVKFEKLPYFGPVSGETFASYMETGLDMIWYASNTDDMNAAKEELTKVGKEFRGKFNLVWLDTDVFERQADGMLGVSEFPALVRTLDGPGRYIFDGKVTSAAVADWIKKMQDGDITPVLKSEPVPETNDEPTKVVVGSEFTKMVADDKDVLLKIYAPWCGHCKKLAPVFDEVSEKVAKLSSKITIAKIDGTANEIPVEGYEFQGFPTLYFKKAGGSPVLYSEGRELDDIMVFLSENATDKFEYTAEPKEEKDDHDEL